MKKTIVTLPEPMFKRIKHIAVDSDRSMTEVIREALQRWLDERMSASLNQHDYFNK